MMIDDTTQPTDDTILEDTAIDTGHPDGDGVMQDGQATPPNEEQSIAAFKSGAAEVSHPDLVKPPEVDPSKDAADVTAAATAAAEALKPPAPPVAPPTDVEKAVAEKLASDKAIAKEMHDLKIDARSRSGIRFREMANTVRELEPFKPVIESLAKVGIKDQAGVDRMLDSAARGVQWEDSVLQSTATPEQFGSAMTVIKCMNSNDLKLLNVAFDVIGKQWATLGAKLGREVPGMVDPLDAHPDLKAAVEDEEITRKFALEQAQLRTSAQLTEQGAQAQHQQSQQQREADAGMQAINQLSAQLAASDPQFQQKLAIIAPQLAAMRGTVHPSQWAAQAATLYATTFIAAPAPAPSPAPVRPKVTHVAPRPGMPVNTLRRDPENDLQSFKLGVESLSQSN